MRRYVQRISDGYLYPYSEVLAQRGDFRVIKANPSQVVNGFLVDGKEGDGQPGAESEPEVEKEASTTSEVSLQEMTKDMLEAYARREFGAELDKRYKKDTLIRQVEAMQKGMTPQEALQITD